MKKFQLYLTMIACGLFLTLNSCDSEELSISPDEVSGVQIEKPEVSAKGTKVASSANGQGTVIYANVSGGTYNRRFAFHANTMPDGTVSGNAVITYIGGEGKIMYKIDCLNIVGNSATMSGTVTSNTITPNNVGAAVKFTVVDNGEGKKADPDQITFVYYSGSGCSTPYGSGLLHDINGGNIQIK